MRAHEDPAAGAWPKCQNPLGATGAARSWTPSAYGAARETGDRCYYTPAEQGRRDGKSLKPTQVRFKIIENVRAPFVLNLNHRVQRYRRFLCDSDDTQIHAAGYARPASNKTDAAGAL
jgi:hypothetical protein